MNAAFVTVAAVMAVITLWFVLRPLTRRAPVTTPVPPAPPREAVEAETPFAALAEIEFDRATGKLSERDYALLRDRYVQRAASALEQDGVTVPVLPDGTVDVAELAIRDARRRAPICPSCGPRPEDDAEFCSSCGRYVAEACPSCQALVVEPGASFCSSCGHALRV
ncbi:MAG: zinc ribbon domain-containing protein [Gemmatimonadaceae bacterium]|nr:zinc ribbon domain-containing protein [Gemmatimonadaceae bacterium]